MSETGTASGTDRGKRRWWAALLLMLLGGAGYLYVGRPRRYATYFAFGALFAIAFYHGLWGWFSDPVVHLWVAGTVLVFSLGFLVDGVRLALVQKQYVLRWYNRWWVYAACGVAMAVLTSLHDLSSGYVSLGVRIYSIPAGSMAPTVMVGDRVTADARAYTASVPQRGDIVIFKLPTVPSVDYIKRVIGLPGERVQMADGVVFINGVAVSRSQAGEAQTPEGRNVLRYEETLPNGVSHLTQHIGGDTWADSTEEFVVPEDHYFMLGDNRDNSNDSRFFDGVGYVPRRNIYARARGIIWATDWSRIGLRLK